MKRRMKIYPVIIALILVFMTVLPAAASQLTNVKLYLPVHLEWVDAGHVTRSTASNNAGALCDSVYPISGVDTYTTVVCRIVNANGTPIGVNQNLSIKEGTGYQKLEIKDGYLDLTTIYFQFRANLYGYAAYALVSMTGNMS